MPADTQVENDYHFAKSFVRATLLDELEARLADPDGSIDELIGYKIVSTLDELPDTNNPN
jgi:ankyrin repeat protein